MKIGIITFHNVDNYGAVLQVYGLQYILNKLGHDAGVVDYRNYKVSEGMFTRARFLSNPLKYSVLFILYASSIRKRIKLFSSFSEKYFNLIGRNISASNIRDLDLDYYILGSDQIWNPRITGGYDGVYWGDKNIYGNAKVFSYAASGKADFIIELENEKVSTSLRNLKQIGVREKKLQIFLKEYFNLSSQLVLDPTLLAGVDCFDNIVEKRLIDDKYVLFYNVEGRKDAIEQAKQIALKKNARLVVLGTSHLFQRISNKNVIFYNASVPEMLSLIKYAEVVVALSFHGTALAIIFNKEFYSLEGGNMDRVESLLSELGLTDRILYRGSDLKTSPVDYSKVNLKLENLRAQSLTFLNNSLV